jgi:hypothetical protein
LGPIPNPQSPIERAGDIPIERYLLTNILLLIKF